MFVDRKCVCRNCGKHYLESKSRADYKGFCSQPCMREKAKSAGFIKGSKKWGTPKPFSNEYLALKSKNWIGSVYEDE